MNNIIAGSYVKYCRAFSKVFKIGTEPYDQHGDIYIGKVAEIINGVCRIIDLRILNHPFLPSAPSTWISIDKLTLLECDNNVSLSDILRMSISGIAGEQFLFVVNTAQNNSNHRIVLRWEDSKLSNLMYYSGFASNDVLKKNYSLFKQIETRDLIKLLHLPANIE